MSEEFEMLPSDEDVLCGLGGYHSIVKMSSSINRIGQQISAFPWCREFKDLIQ